MSPPRSPTRPRRSLRLLVATLAVTGCTATGSLASRHPVVEETREERTMLHDLAGRRETRIGPLEAALIVGGPRDPNELAAMVQALDGALTRIILALPRSDPPSRARALLGALFHPAGGRPLLLHYEADATTLGDVMTTGRFNCVSATMLYILAAGRAGIDARPVLLPSHARALVAIGTQRFIVETTTALGFDPPPSVSREALDRARPKTLGSHVVDLYADEKGTLVDWPALLGIAYGNLSIMAEARGETAIAAALLSREAALTPEAQAPLIKAQQMSLLTELATAALRNGELDRAIALAKSAQAAAPDATSKRFGEQNIAAIASQKLVATAPRLSDAELDAFAEPLREYPTAYGDVRALALTLVAERRLKRGDVDGSARTLREAASVATSDSVREQTGHNSRQGELNRLAQLSATDPEAAWADWQRLGPADPALGARELEVLRVISENRAIRLANDGRCPELDRVLEAASTSSAPVEHQKTLRAACRARHALAASEHGDLELATAELRAAVRIDPDEPRHRQNLAVMIEQQVDRLVHASRCADVAPLIAEGRALDPGATFWDEATAFCHPR